MRWTESGKFKKNCYTFSGNEKCLKNESEIFSAMILQRILHSKEEKHLKERIIAANEKCIPNNREQRKRVDDRK